ncbi:MAG: spore maturation protein [Deltaproteobacteria bacterium]|nr:spore maturation protein [Deltaproteobacteria bacterium]
MFQEVIQTVAHWAIAVFAVGIPVYGMIKGVKVYEAFVEGAKEGFNVVVRIIPYLVAILAVIGAFRASGAMDLISGWLGPFTDRVGLPAANLPLAIVKPLSGGAARGVLADILKTHGADSYTGRLASVMAGCTETTFYVLAVYCGAIGASRFRHALTAGILADLGGVAAAVVFTLLVFGH